MDPALLELLRPDAGAPGEEVEAIVRLDGRDAEPSGMRIVARFGRVATCRVARSAVLAARHAAHVISLKAPRPLGPERRPPAGPAKPTVDRRRPPGTTLTGAGVVVGVVDWGCDVDHPNFRHADGTTRLLALWDQRRSSAAGPEPYGYGTVHDRRTIDAALATDRPYETLSYHPRDADRDGRGSHGTHVMDIAAGNGRVGPAGVAPEAELVFVHLADRDTGGLATLGDSVRLLEAVDFIRHAAGERPWAINISVGRHGGPHDGSSLVELALDELLAEAPGRAVCMSAGNYFAARAHASRRGGRRDRHRLAFEVAAGDISPNELEAWYDGADEYLVQVTAPDGTSSPLVRLGDHAVLDDGERVLGRLYHRRHDPNNGDNHVDLFLYPPAPAGCWTVSFEPVDVRRGVIHAWLERDELGQARFVDPDRRTTIGTIANARLPLVVGAHDAHSRTGALARFSSSGPTRDGRAKPDVLAPGVAVLAARSAPAGCEWSPGLLTRKSGTSMAAPHVTGAAALCLQADATLPAAALRRLVHATAAPSRHAAPSRSGSGCLDVARLLLATTTTTTSREITMNTTSLDADRLYRELTYRPAGRLAAQIRSAYAVVAAPGEPPRDLPRDGDLLVRVALGEPGAGRVCVVVGGSSGLLDRSGRLPRGHLVLRPCREQAWSPDALDLGEAATDLGRDLAARFPDGVRVAIYDAESDAEFNRAATAWARREEAVGITGRTISAAALALGQPMTDTRGLVKTLTDLGAALASATATTSGPAKIRTLAVFSHGWGTTMAIGNGLTAGNVGDVVARMAPVLADDVTIIMYGCSVCSQPGEGGWVETTMRGGGEASLCALVRDALVDAGKASATVWGHTEVGHTTTNWSLRRFRAAAGKGTAGEAFAGDIVFGAMRAGALAQVEAAVRAQAHEVVAARRADFERFALARLERQFYSGYGDANKRLTHGGANLAERAPVQPDAVAEVIRTHWRDTYWTAARVNAMATELIRRMKPMKIVQGVAAGRPGESFEPVDAEPAIAVTAAKDQIRTAVRGWGTDEAAILAALRGLTPPDLAEIGSDEAIIDLLRGDLNASELRAVGAVLARGRVGGFTRAELALVTANPGSHRLGTIAAALARDALLAHHESVDRTGTGTIHGSTCGTAAPPGTTTLDCTTYGTNVLDAAYTAKGRATVWADVMREARRASGRDLKGTEILRALQRLDGWQAVFWSPDPRHPQDRTSEHPFAYRIVRERGTYYGITVDNTKSVIDYRRTSPGAAVQTDGLERLRRLPFGALAARGGTHMAVIVNGDVYEVHRHLPATDRNAIEATPLERFAWQSGVIAAPPGDLALAWKTP